MQSEVNDVAARTVNIMSLCTGIGGLDIGLHAAIGDAARTVLVCEGEAYCASVLRARMQDGNFDECPIWDDLRTFDATPWRGVVDIITAGFPCQPFSAAGKRKGENDPRHLWPYIAAHVWTIKPAVVFCENVPGLLTLGFDQVVQDLSAMGYLVEAGIFSAAEIGAPHLRKRLFFIAYTSGARLETLCRDTLRVKQAARKRFVARAVGQRNVADAIYAKRWPKRAGRLAMGRQNDRLHADWQQSSSCAADSGPDVADPESIHSGRKVDAAQDKQWLTPGGCPQTTPRNIDWGAKCCVGVSSNGISRPLDYNLWANGWESDVPRVCDKQEHRIDKLRALGNAVVPGVAALAWQTLVHQALTRDTLSHAPFQNAVCP